MGRTNASGVKAYLDAGRELALADHRAPNQAKVGQVARQIRFIPFGSMGTSVGHRAS